MNSSSLRLIASSSAGSPPRGEPVEFVSGNQVLKSRRELPSSSQDALREVRDLFFGARDVDASAKLTEIAARLDDRTPSLKYLENFMKLNACCLFIPVQKLGKKTNAALTAGCKLVREEKVSGAKLEGRAELDLLMKFMNRGDTLMVTKIDRLARSLRDLQNIVHELEQRGIVLKATDQPICRSMRFPIASRTASATKASADG